MAKPRIFHREVVYNMDGRLHTFFKRLSLSSGKSLTWLINKACARYLGIDIDTLSDTVKVPFNSGNKRIPNKARQRVTFLMDITLNRRFKELMKGRDRDMAYLINQACADFAGINLDGSNTVRSGKTAMTVPEHQETKRPRRRKAIRRGPTNIPRNKADSREGE